MRPVLRFAPSPNSPLHLGHALSALTGFEMATACGGRFLLRIEDIDLARTRQAHVDGILCDLAWLGIDWETPVMRQSTRVCVYRAAADRLRAEGLLYPCFAHRSEIQALAEHDDRPRDPDGAPLFDAVLRQKLEPEAATRFKRGEPYALRLDMSRAMNAAYRRLGAQPLTFGEILPSGVLETRAACPQRWGDVIIMRKEAPASYHLAVVIDDAAQGVTHVTRGQDLLAATDLHRLLQVLLDLPEPVYHHHRLIVRPDGRKLSKSAGDESLAMLRAANMTADEVKLGLGMKPPRIDGSDVHAVSHLK